MAKKTLILGASGMLGSMIADYLSRDPEITLTVAVRNNAASEEMAKILPGIKTEYFEVNEFLAGARDVEWLKSYDYIINCIGITKPYCNDNNPDEIVRAVEINSIFPNKLAEELSDTSTKILQIATDCVYSGRTGLSLESDPHDATDVYGKTKSLGESKCAILFNIRCSIIGPEWKRNTFLLEWLINQPKNATLKGFTNHDWNGVTTLSFARLCHGVIKNDIELPNLQHIVPWNILSKYELLIHMAKAYGREDIIINPHEAEKIVDRTLATSNSELNESIWKCAGYDKIPTIEEMIAEIGKFDYRFKEAL